MSFLRTHDFTGKTVIPFCTHEGGGFGQIENDINIVDLLTDASICSSKREAREFISNGSISINGQKMTDLEFKVTKNVAIEHKYIVIRRGKKKYYIVVFN